MKGVSKTTGSLRPRQIAKAASADIDAMCECRNALLLNLRLSEFTTEKEPTAFSWAMLGRCLTATLMTNQDFNNVLNSAANKGHAHVVTGREEQGLTSGDR